MWIVLAFVFASFLAVVPLLMAVVAIPSTLLIINGLARITDVSFIVQFLVLAHAHRHAKLVLNHGNIALLGYAAELGLIAAPLAGLIAVSGSIRT